MKWWLAVLALIPALSWAGCYSADTRLEYLEYAQMVIEVRDLGASERQVLENATGGEVSAPHRAALLTAVEIAYTYPDVGPSLIAKRMSQECDAENRRSMRAR